MAQKLIVDFEDLLVVAEEVAHFSHFLAIRSSHAPYPGRGIALLNLGHRDALGVVRDHTISFIIYRLGFSVENPHGL